MIDKTINPHIDRLALKLRTVPETPGVYQHLDASGKVIYVGKARNLQRRVSQYFNRYEDHSSKIKMLVRNIYDFRVTVVATEVDALLLENTLIKQYKPKYNSLLKDDKSYPYLCLTNEEYPRLLFARQHDNTKGQYFGPYPNQRILRELQGIIRTLFRYRTCHLPLSEHDISSRTFRPCINHQIGLCNAPCAGLESRTQYLATIEDIRQILKGNFSDIERTMRDQMFQLAEELRFEEAEGLRRKIRLLEEYQSRSTVVNTAVHDVDVYSILSNDSRYAYVNILRIKNGTLIYSYSTEIKKHPDDTPEELLATAIPQLHELTQSTAREAIVPIPVSDIPEAYLKLVVPTRGGDKKLLLELSQRNVEAYQKQCTHQRALLNPDQSNREARQKDHHLLLRIQKELHLPELPTHIECFDNSNIQGAYPVAAMVRFTNGKPNKKEYRKFNIKTVEGPDDYASMAEVIYRRYSRLHNEGKELPQLLIVDGGKGQMEMARQVIQDQLHLDIPIAGLAKDDRHHTSELLYGFPPKEIGLRPTDPLFHLLERIQDEVHRFAITFHRQKRSKNFLQTQLTEIPGIGEKTAHDLLLRFGSVKEIKIQSLADITQVIGQAKGKLVYHHFHPED